MSRRRSREVETQRLSPGTGARPTTGRVRAEDRILGAMRAMIQALDQYSSVLHQKWGITGPQLMGLNVLASRGAMTQKDLSDQIHVGPSTLVGILDRLQARGWVERIPHPNDRRKTLVQATPSGQALAVQVPSLLHGGVARGLKRLSATERNSIANSLEQVVEMMKPMPRPAEAALGKQTSRLPSPNPDRARTRQR